jgi:hypothetical protein
MPIKRAEIPIECDYQVFLKNLSDDLSSSAIFNDDKPFFKGRIENNHFKIWQNFILKGWEPVVYGKQLIDSGGSKLSLFIRINLFGLIITLIFYLYAFYDIYRYGFESILIISLMVLPLVAFYQFYKESANTEKRIREIIRISSSANKQLE